MNITTLQAMNRHLLEDLLSKRVKDAEVLGRMTVHENVKCTIEKFIFKMKETIYECLKIYDGMTEDIFTESKK